MTELPPGTPRTVAGVEVTGWEVDHPSGAPALALRLGLGGRVVAYTGDTAWTDILLSVADGADLLIAEAYRMDKAVPFHLRHADLAARRHLLTSARIVLTHMGPDVLSRPGEVLFETARDGLVLDI